MRKLVVIFMLGLLASCGSNDDSAGACAGSTLLGNWTSGYNRLEFRPNCTGYASFCQSEFSYRNTTAQTGRVAFESFSNNRDAYCTSNSGRSCTYDVGKSGLYLSCGFAAEYFTRE